MKRIYAAVFGLIALSMSSATARASYAITLPDNQAATVAGGSQTLGYTFTVNANVTVTSLGIYENASSGLADSHAVGIFDGSGSLLTSSTIAAGNTAPVGGFVYQAVTPTLLVTGTTYVIGASYLDQDKDLFVISAPAAVINPSVLYGHAAQASGSGLIDPTNNINYVGQGVFGPSFIFNAVPEPSAYVLMGVGLAGLAGVRLLRRRSAS